MECFQNIQNEYNILNLDLYKTTVIKVIIYKTYANGETIVKYLRIRN